MQNLMIAIVRRKKESLNLTITMEMQKRERSWMVAEKGRGKRCNIQTARQRWL